MNDKELKRYLRQLLQQDVAMGKTSGEASEAPVQKPPEKAAGLAKTVTLCIAMMREQALARPQREEMRTGFVQYLSDVFRFEGISIFRLQAVALLIICLGFSTLAGVSKYIPVFIPLLVLAIMPAMFKGQYYGMNEMEAATRASGPQIILAKLVLAGAANLVCITVLIFLAIYLQNSYREIGQMILYCFVPYLVCMVSMLYLIRLRRRQNMQLCVMVVLSSCVCWGVLAKALPWLYEASAFGLWIAAFLFFAAFFIKEIYFILMMRKEGKMYGIIT